jgi:hypothetical protein
VRNCEFCVGSSRCGHVCPLAGHIPSVTSWRGLSAHAEVQSTVDRLSQSENTVEYRLMGFRSHYLVDWRYLAHWIVPLVESKTSIAVVRRNAHIEFQGLAESTILEVMLA